MLLAPNHRRACDKPLRQTLEDSVSEIEHSLRSLKFKDSTAEAGNEPPKSSSFGNMAASCQPAKPASLRFWQAHLKPAAPHGQRLAIAHDKVWKLLPFTPAFVAKNIPFLLAVQTCACGRAGYAASLKCSRVGCAVAYNLLPWDRCFLSATAANRHAVSHATVVSTCHISLALLLCCAAGLQSWSC